MKKYRLCLSVLFIWLIQTGAVFGQTDIKNHPSCPLCGMDRKQQAHSRMVVEYAEGLIRGTCSLHCTAGEMTVNRDKTLKSVQAADYRTGQLVPADQAYWVIGGNKPGVMTRRAKWAFRDKESAEAFIKANGGQAADFQQALQATFEDMYRDIQMVRDQRRPQPAELPDVAAHPECKYCGMFRKKFAHSRALVEYRDYTAVGTCSIHCLAIDLALNPDKYPKKILVGDYHSRMLIDAEKAFWVLGGSQAAVMSIRGKWAFAEQAGAEAFIKAYGGLPASFDRVMKATFEDMYQILR